MTVPDLLGSRAKAKLPPGPIGYALASRDDKTALIFRAYDILPPDAQFAGDMAAALERRITPMISADLATRKLTISTDQNAGLVLPKPDVQPQR